MYMASSLGDVLSVNQHFNRFFIAYRRMIAPPLNSNDQQKLNCDIDTRKFATLESSTNGI
jgi:hypothetical protein